MNQYRPSERANSLITSPSVEYLGKLEGIKKFKSWAEIIRYVTKHAVCGILVSDWAFGFERVELGSGLLYFSGVYDDQSYYRPFPEGRDLKRMLFDVYDKLERRWAYIHAKRYLWIRKHISRHPDWVPLALGYDRSLWVHKGGEYYMELSCLSVQIYYTKGYLDPHNWWRVYVGTIPNWMGTKQGYEALRDLIDSDVSLVVRQGIGLVDGGYELYLSGMKFGYTLGLMGKSNMYATNKNVIYDMLIREGYIATCDKWLFPYPGMCELVLGGMRRHKGIEFGDIRELVGWVNDNIRF